MLMLVVVVVKLSLLTLNVYVLANFLSLLRLYKVKCYSLHGDDKLNEV